MHLLRTLAAGAALLAFAGAAQAGEQYVDASGFAVSGYDVVAYGGLAQGEPGRPQPAAVKGSQEFQATYNGATWLFANAANRDAFLADPARYAPAYDGHCAYGVGKGGKVPGNPNLWRIVDGKLYLNINRQVVGFWEADIPGNVAAAEQNWPGLEPAPASTKDVPNF